MKVFALLFLVGCALANQSEWRWQSGKQHVFEYSGRLLTGIPQLASHYSGLGINATVLIDVLAANKLQLSLEQPKFAKVNERLEARMNSQDGLDGDNWREVFLPQMSEVSSEFRQILEQPIIFELVQGEIREAKISRDEPEWAVNFKKALALLFQTKFDAAAWEPERNQISSSFSDNFWKTKEESIDGICEVTYQINELPKYMIRDRPEMVPYPEQCQGQKYYEVIKTKNVDNCEKRSAFSFYKPGFFKCSGPNCKNMWARTSETRVIACGSRGNMMIQSIVNQGELTQNLLGIKTERIVSGNLQILRLKEVRSASPKPQPQDLTQIKNMMFEYSYKSYQSQQQETQEEQESRRIPKDLLEQPEELGKILPSSRLHGQKSKMPKSEIKQQIKTLMQSIIREMTNPQLENLSEKQVTLKVLSAARGMSMLAKSDIETLYEQIKLEFASNEIHRSIAKNLFYDTTLMAATPEAIRFLKDQMMKKEMTHLELFSLMAWMPNNLMVPHQQILEEIFQLVTSQEIQECQVCRNIATMSFSTLLEKACLARNRATSFPTWVMGEFCTPESPILKEKWIPYLLKDLEQTQEWYRRNDIIVSLGLLPSQDLIGKLVPFLEGKFQGQPVPQMTRLLALWSLSNVAVQQPQVMEPIYFAIYSNPAESTEMRISAFNALLKLNPTIPTFHKIASRTWTEQDKEVLRAVNTALATLSSESYIRSVSFNLDVTNLAKKAKLIYPLIKKTQGGIFLVSASLFGADYLPKLDTGYETISEWIASKKSFLPRDVYFQVTYFLSQYQFNFIQTGYRLEGIENMYRKVAQLITPTKPGQSVQEQTEEIAKQLQDNLNSQWRQIIQKLSIKPRDDNDKISGAGFLRLQEIAPVFGNFHEMTVETLKEKINKFFGANDLKSMVNGKEHRIVFKRTVDAAPYMGLLPTDMGFPLNIEFHLPIMVSVDAKAKINAVLPKPEMKIESRFFYSAQYVGWVGTLIPFTKEWAATVIDETKVYNMPAIIKAEIDIPNHHVKLALEMDPTMTKVTDLVHHHVHPFTTIQKVEDFTPVTLSAQKVMIKSLDEPKEIKTTFGESMGLHLTTAIRSESRFLDMRSVVERLALFNFNPINSYMFSWAEFGMNLRGEPSLRRHEYSLTLDPTQSMTKELIMDLKVGVATKSQESQGQVRYHKIKVLSKSEQEQRVQEETCPIMKQVKRVIPLGVVSEQLEHKSMHPQRQTKLEQVIANIVESSVESAQAVTVKVATTIKGRRPHTSSYSVSGVAGIKSEPRERKVQTKLHLEVESEQLRNKIVLNGKMLSPVLPIWDVHAIRSSMVDYRVFTSLQYLKNGQKEWNIDVDTKAQTTHEQKEYSRKSPEAKLCQKLSQRQENNEVTISKLSEACESMRQQARALDEVQITIKYNNVPRWIEIAESKSVEIFKTLMWPFLKVDYERMQNRQESIRSMPVYARIQFHKETPSFDLTIERPQEKMLFEQIRMPYPLNLVLPLKGGMNNVKLAAQKASSHSLYPVCKLEKTAMQTFDNRSLPLILDQCYHLVAADCSKDQSFGVLSRQMPGSSRKEVQIFLGKHEIKIDSQLRLIVDGQVEEVKPEQWTQVKKIAQVFRSQNQVLEISAPYYTLSLTFDGETLAVQTSQYVKGQMCGLCGNQNQQKKDEVQGPQKCMFSQPEVESASYRVENYPQGCDAQKPLSVHIKEKLQKERQQCLKQKIIPTKISKSLKTQNGPCTILKHAVVRKPGQICISKKAVTQCAAGCQPSHAQLLEKQIPFTCLKEDRVAEHYAKKAERGERLSELEQRPTSFETKVPQPRSCVPASNEL